MEHTKGLLVVDPGVPGSPRSAATVRDISPLTAAALGSSVGAIVGTPVCDLVHPSFRDVFDRAIHRPQDAVPNAPIRFHHATRAKPVDFEFSVAQDIDSVRVVLTDVASWRAVEFASQFDATTVPTPTVNADQPREHSQCFVLRLDNQCTLTSANEAWTQLTGVLMEPRPGAWIGPSTWMKVFDRDLINRFGQSLSGLAAGTPFTADGVMLDGRGGTRPVTVAACALDAGRSGFVLVGVERGPAAQALTVQPEAPTKDCSPMASHIERTAPVPVRTGPDRQLDPRTRAIIATVLSAARTATPADTRGDTPADTSSGDASGDTSCDEAGLFDKPSADDGACEAPFMISPTLGSAARDTLAEHLAALHDDGLDAVVSIALLLIEVELSTQTAEDEDYEMGVLERRLRSAIRDHEYADRHDPRGFVVAARGGFGHTDLQALALRIANRLQAPMRGHEATDLISLRVSAVRSRPGETDQLLITRAEEASAHAADRDLIVYVPTQTS